MSVEEVWKEVLGCRDILHIRLLYKVGHSISDIAKQFNASETNIRGIVNGTRRSEDTESFSIHTVSNLGDKTLKTKLSEVELEEIPIVVSKCKSKDYVCLSLEDFFNLVEKDKVVGKRVFKK